MITHAWTLLCATSIIDQETQQISLIDIIDYAAFHPDEIRENEDGRPYALLEGQIATLWRRENLENAAFGQAKIELVRPGNAPEEGPEAEIDLSEKWAQRAITQIAIPVEEGNHVFKTYLKTPGREWHLVNELPVEVVFLDAKDLDDHETLHA
jgi:hypothetical protein